MKVVYFYLPFLWQLNPVLLVAYWLLGTWGLQFVPEFENNEHLPVARWQVSSSSAPGWTRQVWMGFTSVSCFMDACQYFRISAYAALKMNSGVRWYNERYASLCLNVTQVVTWPITSYGGPGGKYPAPRAPINRFGKKNSTLKLKNPPIDLIFGKV